MVPSLRAVTPELESFMQDVLKDGSLKLRPPADALLFTDCIDGVVTSLVLYREGQFQVEMIVVAPGTGIPEHSHPDVDSYEVAIAGDIAFFIDGIQTGFNRAPAANGMSRDFGKFVPIPNDAPHYGRSGKLGTIFLSVQQWRDGVAPTHVGLNWTEKGI
jgi:hypothetical protein